jgi:uncharacterized protein (DUF488 family)
MKYGFSKFSLRRCCEALGIKYRHFPEVGIDSSQRQDLNDQADYEMLFDAYKKDNLFRTKSVQREILNILNSEKRIALTCFEAEICQCHRKYLSEAISILASNKYPLRHL